MRAALGHSHNAIAHPTGCGAIGRHHGDVDAPTASLGHHPVGVPDPDQLVDLRGGDHAPSLEERHSPRPQSQPFARIPTNSPATSRSCAGDAKPRKRPPRWGRPPKMVVGLRTPRRRWDLDRTGTQLRGRRQRGGAGDTRRKGHFTLPPSSPDLDARLSTRQCHRWRRTVDNTPTRSVAPVQNGVGSRDGGPGRRPRIRSQSASLLRRLATGAHD